MWVTENQVNYRLTLFNEVNMETFKFLDKIVHDNREYNRVK